MRGLNSKIPSLFLLNLNFLKVLFDNIPNPEKTTGEYFAKYFNQLHVLYTILKPNKSVCCADSLYLINMM